MRAKATSAPVDAGTWAITEPTIADAGKPTPTVGWGVKGGVFLGGMGSSILGGAVAAELGGDHFTIAASAHTGGQLATYGASRFIPRLHYQPLSLGGHVGGIGQMMVVGGVASWLWREGLDGVGVKEGSVLKHPVVEAGASMGLAYALERGAGAVGLGRALGAVGRVAGVVGLAYEAVSVPGNISPKQWESWKASAEYFVREATEAEEARASEGLKCSDPKPGAKSLEHTVPAPPLASFPPKKVIQKGGASSILPKPSSKQSLPPFFTPAK
jgi:hypothetical protein